MWASTTAEAKELIGILLGGVQSHLGAADEPSRRCGMRVGELVSEIIDPEKPLRFVALSFLWSSSMLQRLSSATRLSVTIRIPTRAMKTMTRPQQ